MTEIAMVFPGQGAQKVGMGKDWYEQTDFGRELFDQADAVLGYSLRQVCFEGPEDELTKTANAQPALYLCSAIVFQALRERGVSPRIVAGHSLGEISALYAAGVFDFATGLRLVHERGKAMNKAAEVRPGSMAAVIGFDIQSLEEICQATSGICNVANINSPGQIVMSGETEAVQQAAEKAKAAGAKRAIMLPVHGAFHSPLMDEAETRMAEVLESTELNQPSVTFFNNVDAAMLTDPDEIRGSLVRQITAPVRWAEIMEKIIEQKPDAIVEVGTGKLLTGMFKRMKSGIPLFNCETIESVENLSAEIIKSE